VPLDALALALAAAAVHAVWNLLTARADDSHATLAVAMVTGALVCAPVAALDWDVEGAVAPYVAASVAFELGYLTLLATAYARAPMSVVYPVARGAAPVIVLVVGALALGAAPTVGAAVGVLAVTAGILLVRGGGGRGERGAGRGTWLGLAVAACIAGYTLVDHAGLDHAAPLAYLEIALAPTAALYLAGVLAVHGGAAVRAAIAPPALLAGVGIYAAYGLALLALARAPAAPVAAVRESSVVMATGLAAVVMHERVERGRWGGAVLVVAGVAAIAMAG
jgi:drug/metabolite transporter (DMT)-like permease